MQATPPTIFKYEAFTLQALQNLKRHSVYFGSPKNFNDPYDCAISAPVEDPTPEQIDAVVRYYLADPDVPNKYKKIMRRTPVDELRRLLRRSAQAIADKSRDEFFAKCGVTCLSELNDNLLM